MRELKLADNMRELRITNEYSQQFISNHIHIARQTYSLYETGRRIPDLKTVCDLAELYHIPVDLLLYVDLSCSDNMADASTVKYTIGAAEQNSFSLSGVDARMLTNYKSLSPEVQEEVREFVLFKKRWSEAKEHTQK